MDKWYMLTLVGEDHQGIVAQVATILSQLGYDLGEASMMRLGGNFTIMLMIHGGDGEDAVRRIKDDMALCAHVIPVQGGLHQHLEPNLRVTVSGADRSGIVAEVTDALVKQDVNILDLESDVAGTAQNPIYIMHIEGVSEQDAETVGAALTSMTQGGIDIKVTDIETLVG